MKQMMMRGIYVAACVGLLLGPAVACAENGLKVTYDMSGMPLTITRDAAGTVQFDGLPYPGLVLYRPQTGVVYYQQNDDPVWLTVPPGALATVVRPAKVVAGPAWQPWPAVGSPQPTKRFDVKVTDETDEKVTCAPVFGSTYAARMAGMDIADLQRVLATLEWMHGGRITAPCDAADYAPDDVKAMGLPVIFAGPNGEWKLDDIVQADVPYIALPTAPQPFDERAHLTLLLSQFGPEEREAFLKQYGELPLAQQLDMVSRNLMMDAQP